MATETDVTEAPLLDRIAAKRERLLKMDDRHRAARAREVRELAVLIAATRDDPDPGVNPTAASKVMGTAKGWAHRLVKQLEAGELDVEGGQS